MAGHSKWSKIKRTKAALDIKKGAVFTRLGQEISTAAKAGSDPARNFQLRTAISKAKASGVPAVNIERAITKGSSRQSEGEAGLKAICYEGYGPGSVAILVEALTDNRNRTAADLRLAFSKYGGSLGESGCAAYLFEQRSEVCLQAMPPVKSAASSPEEILLESLVELESAQDYILGVDGIVRVQGPFAALEELHSGLQKQGWQLLSWGRCWIPLTVICPEEKLVERCLALLTAINLLDDVQLLVSNLNLDV